MPPRLTSSHFESQALNLRSFEFSRSVASLQFASCEVGMATSDVLELADKSVNGSGIDALHLWRSTLPDAVQDPGPFLSA